MLSQFAGNLRQGYAPQSSPAARAPRHGSAAMRESARSTLTEVANFRSGFALALAEPARGSMRHCGLWGAFRVVTQGAFSLSAQLFGYQDFGVAAGSLRRRELPIIPSMGTANQVGRWCVPVSRRRTRITSASPLATVSGRGASLHLLRHLETLLGGHCGHNSQVKDIIPIHDRLHD